MKEEVSGMGRPNSRAELCAWVLGLMGAFFLLFGGAVLLWDIPVGGAGPDWAFLPIGAALLAAGGGCALACLARRRSQARLRREGTAVSGTVRSVRHHIFVTWNTQSFVNVPGPSILFFDEPTSALDPELTGEILEVIRLLADDHMTMVIVTHEMSFARAISNRVIFMADGTIIEEGPPEHFFENPTHERTKQFLSKILR